MEGQLVTHSEKHSEQKSNEIKVVFGDINKNNVEQMRQLNNLCLPIRYQDGFYTRIILKLRYGKFGK